MCFKCLFTLWVFGFDELLYIFKSQFLMLKMEIVFFFFFFFPSIHPNRLHFPSFSKITRPNPGVASPHSFAAWVLFGLSLLLRLAGDRRIEEIETRYPMFSLL